MPSPPVLTTPASSKSSNLARSFLVRPKNFDSSLTWQNNIGAGRREVKSMTNGRMIKSKLSSKVINPPHKSPKKTKNKSSRKHLSGTTPSKVSCTKMEI